MKPPVSEKVGKKVFFFILPLHRGHKTKTLLID